MGTGRCPCGGYDTVEVPQGMCGSNHRAVHHRLCSILSARFGSVIISTFLSDRLSVKKLSPQHQTKENRQQFQGLSAIFFCFMHRPWVRIHKAGCRRSRQSRRADLQMFCAYFWYLAHRKRAEQEKIGIFFQNKCYWRAKMVL